MKILHEEYQQIYEMATIGTMSDTLTIRVYDKEGKIPHFHLTKGTGPNFTFECCIQIKRPEYFKHPTSKHKNNQKNDTVSKSQIIEVDTFLRSTHVRGRTTNWEVLLDVWTSCNPNTPIYEVTQPDYTVLG